MRRLWAPLLAFCLFCAPAQAAELSCVLLLEHAAPSPYTDMLKAGLERAGREFGLKTAVIVAGEDDDQTEIFRQAAAENDMVIVATDAFYDILRDNAANYRRCKFAVVDAGIRAANVSCITFADEQASFLAGACAALIAKARGKPLIGWLSGRDTPAMRSLFSGYAAGAETAVPGMRVIQAVVGSFTDEEAAAKKAAQLEDAAVIALAAGAGNAAAARRLAQTSALAISVDAWLPDLLPGRVAAAITKAADRAVHELCSAFAKGDFRAKEIAVFNLENGGVDLVGPKPAGGEKFPEAARRVEELRRELVAGNIPLASMRERTLCDCLD